MPEIDVDFHDPRLSMNYWWPRIDALDIPTPETILVPLEDVMGEDGDINLQPIIDAAESLDTNQYFLRGDTKAARVIEEGSFLNSTDEQAVRFTLEQLCSSFLLNDQLVNCIAVRERLDLDEHVHCYGKPVAPEVRVFVDEGEVLCRHLRVTDDDLNLSSSSTTELADELDELVADETEMDHSETGDEDEQTNEAVLREMRGIIDDEWETRIKPHAEAVANEFSDSSWSVDFLRGAGGTWYQTDMALYGLYYRGMGDNGGWTSLSAHDADCPHNLEHNQPADLPESPANARTERKINVDDMMSDILE